MRGLIGDLCIKICLVNQNPAETCQVFGKNFSGQLYKENGCFPAWLFTIVRRRLVDFQRQRISVPLDEHPSADPDLLDVIQANENVERLYHLISQMDNEKQELLRLRFTAKLSFVEIAALENQSEAAVKMAVYRAIQWLREHWEGENG
jgi:RNA polymerase sigma-70 factor (ECF subfamily)